MGRAGMLTCVAVAVLGALGCAHTVGWDPIHYETPLGPKTPGKVSLYMDDELETATYSFRAFGSGIANSWVVPYGTRVHEFAQGYLSQGFTDYAEVDSPQVSSGMLVDITGVQYRVSGQAAHVTISMEASGGSGESLLARSYSADGPSGAGAVFGGGAFAQKGMIRRSTNLALHQIFQEMLADLRTAAGR